MRYAICIGNEGYPASLELRKVYEVISDAAAENHQLIRVVDESGEDYLYPTEYFGPIELPKAAERIFSATSQEVCVWNRKTSGETLKSCPKKPSSRSLTS
jgi:hypothetical protein